MNLILASASPRRRELLAQAGYSFMVRAAHIPEDPRPDEDPIAYVVRLAREKAEAVFGQIVRDGASAGAKAPSSISGESARLKSCPVTKQIGADCANDGISVQGGTDCANDGIAAQGGTDCANDGIAVQGGTDCANDGTALQCGTDCADDGIAAQGGTDCANDGIAVQGGTDCADGGIAVQIGADCADGGIAAQGGTDCANDGTAVSAADIPGENLHERLIVLGADTTVTLDGQILGKPEDAADAARMLRMLSGRTHRVITGVALATASGTEVAAEATAVSFLTLSDQEIAEYVATGEPLDKAGAYAIQGRAAKWIPRVEGCYFNVVGLPLALVATMLESVRVPGR